MGRGSRQTKPPQLPSNAKGIGPSSSNGPAHGRGLLPSAPATYTPLKRPPLLNRRTSASYDAHKRKAKAAGQTLDYDLAAFRNFVETYFAGPIQPACPYCHQELTIATFTIDHATPVSRGGSFGLNNLHLACQRCNKIKGPLTHQEYYDLASLMRQWPPTARSNTIARLIAGSQYARHVKN